MLQQKRFSRCPALFDYSPVDFEILPRPDEPPPSAELSTLVPLMNILPSARPSSINTTSILSDIV